MINTQKPKTPSSASTSDSEISEEQEESKPVSAKRQFRRKPKDADAQKDKQDKKKKKKKNVTICLTNCRYEVIRKVAQKFGLKEVTETENWNMYWTDLSISIERCKEMKRFQRINHFPGIYYSL